MKIIKISFLIFGLLGLGNIYSQSGQTVNEGVLYVSPATLMTVVSDFNNTDMGEYENNGEVLFQGHFNNDGITLFDSQYQGYTRFEGIVQQNISGSIPADFYDVLFRNGAAQPAFRLSGNISISGNADFVAGIVDNEDFGGLMVFEEAATHTNVDNFSHVDGYVQKNGAEEFQYPIGDGNYYRFARISPTGNSTQSFTGKYFLENSDLLYPHANRAGIIELIDNREYWTVTKDTSGEDVFVTLSWNEATTPSEIITEPYEDIHIVRWDDVQNLWVSEGGIVDLENKTVHTASRVEGYGVFTLARVRGNLINPGNVVIYNAVTPNDDGHNDYFLIDNIEDFPNNNVLIFNRWGIEVYSARGYNNNDVSFKGTSDGRVTMSGSNMLPTGHYFYIIDYFFDGDDDPRWVRKAGYLYLTTE
jgi:gliding motility-associated-like protein